MARNLQAGRPCGAYATVAEGQRAPVSRCASDVVLYLTNTPCLGRRQPSMQMRISPETDWGEGQKRLTLLERLIPSLIF
jgi:hypothetical protein